MQAAYATSPLAPMTSIRHVRTLASGSTQAGTRKGGLPWRARLGRLKANRPVAGTARTAPAPPASLDFRLVCAETGLVPGEHCPNQLIDYYLPGTSSARRCEHQQEALVSADGAITYCRACVPTAAPVR